jgi:hypothetical protein
MAAVQGPDLRMQGLPAGLALHRALLGGPWDVMGWHEHSYRLLGQRHGVLAHQVIHGIEGLLMGEEHLVQGFPEILEQMKAVCDLRGGGGPLTCPLGIGL